MTDTSSETLRFDQMNLAPPLLQALQEVGYEIPTPIQAQAIPHLLEGLDLLGHAPTGTGKTAAFALPLLSRIDLRSRHVQVMTLTPTRELAIQVAEAFQRYASHMQGFSVVPIYGGQEYGGQIRQLKRGAQVVVGTPGRVMDHMRKGTLKLGGLQALVLDEADEMLRMGFVDEVEWILEQTPPTRQMALFSATMPKAVERIARRHLDDPHEISIRARTATAETVRQRYWQVSGFHKLDALTRILEVEDFDAVLVFVRTRIATAELAERLNARGYTAAAMNGDMVQKQREKTVDAFKSGKLDILVATDVAARGLDVDRISHVVNYDIPYDIEAYIHRIGRTGRAGRRGDAILFVAPRERRMLAAIERATRQKISELEMPTTETVNNKRIAAFKQKITDTLARDEVAFMRGLVEQYQRDHDVPALDIAAALAQMSIGDKPLLLTQAEMRPAAGRDRSKERGSQRNARGSDSKSRSHGLPDEDKEQFRIEVGHRHGVKPGNIVGAIANEAGLDSRHIGRIEIEDEYTLIDLPIGMPKPVFRDLRKVWVCGQQLNISRVGGAPRKAAAEPARGKPHRGSKSFDRKARPGKPKRGPGNAKPATRSVKPRTDKPAPETGAPGFEADAARSATGKPKRESGKAKPKKGKSKPKAGKRTARDKKPKKPKKGKRKDAGA